MARTRTNTLMIASLMLSLILSGIQNVALHPAFMNHGSASDASQFSHSGMNPALLPDPASMDHGSQSHEHHGLGQLSSGHHSSDPGLKSPTALPDADHQKADDCRLKCVLAMCVSGSAALLATEFHYPQEAPVLTASVPVFLLQSHPENPFRPPIFA